MKRGLSYVLLAVLAFCLLTGCGGQAAETSKDATILTDMLGREVTLPEEIDRIVVLSAAECEIVYALGAGDLVVGRGEYCNYPAEVLEVPSVKSGSETNIEQIIALDPQVVLMSTMDQSEDDTTALENAGICVINTKERDIEATYESIRLIGQVLCKESEADALVGSMQDTFAALQQAAAEKAGDEPLSVYFEISPLEWGLWTGGTGTFLQEFADLLGLENLFADVQGWAEVSEEQVLDRNPDIIVTTSYYAGEGASPIDEILGRSGWDTLSALENGRVFWADSDMCSRPGPRLADAAQQLYDLVYGE